VWWGPGKGLGIFRVNVLCQQPVSVAVGKEFFIFLLRQPSPTALALKLLAKTPLPTTSQSRWETMFAFFFFSFHFFAGFSYYNYISTS
jgi:hypothetical protein